MLSYNRLFGQRAALNYINDLTKGFAVINFNIEGEYWYGKPRADYEEGQLKALENAVSPASVGTSLTGTKSTQ